MLERKEYQVGIILFLVLGIVCLAWYLSIKKKEKQKFLQNYKRYRQGDKGVFVNSHSNYSKHAIDIGNDELSPTLTDAFYISNINHDDFFGNTEEEK